MGEASITAEVFGKTRPIINCIVFTNCQKGGGTISGLVKFTCLLLETEQILKKHHYLMVDFHLHTITTNYENIEEF